MDDSNDSIEIGPARFEQHQTFLVTNLVWNEAGVEEQTVAGHLDRRWMQPRIQKGVERVHPKMVEGVPRLT